ncbi:MAG TPA: phosphatidylinositol-specific phospholipase C domain-containing protein [Actinomycetota bacterium]|jgi:hypothetical protein|nr:phosphatidylinositol-specific phospholipase C domain-containing protein [Actinomycetota bacterium]
MRARTVLLAFLAVSALVAPARAQDLTDLADACHDAGGDARQCRGLEHFFHTLGVICRDAASNDPGCASVDGTTISPERVTAHERSWLARALGMQRTLDDDVPLQEELWTHTHNSYNADVYPPTFYGTDRNQIYSITDQLRMGIRAIEIDLHWAHSAAAGTPETQGKAVVVCHGTQVPTPITTVHVGCSVNDPSLDERLREIKDWLARNRDQVVLLYLENQLENNPAAHALATKSIQKVLGSQVYKPSKRCAPLPYSTSRRRIRDTGARVIITGNCGPGAWGEWVHVRGTPEEVPKNAAQWRESGLDHGNDYPAFPCTQRRKEENYAKNWIRHWGDETGLSNGAGGGGDVTPADARNMVRCGVNMIGLDNLVPFDERLAQLVWSWAPNEPRSGTCAYQGKDGRFRSDGCGKHRRFACFDGQSWTVTAGAGPWQAGRGACRGAASAFAVPRTGYTNELLKGAKPSGAEVWLAYRRVAGAWLPTS